jgi:hypothetical protein
VEHWGWAFGALVLQEIVWLSGECCVGKQFKKRSLYSIL